MNDLTNLSDQELMQLYQSRKTGQQTAPAAPNVSKMSNDELIALFESTRGKQPPGVVEDVTKTVPSALARGVSYVAAMPRDMKDLGGEALKKLGLSPEALQAYQGIMRQVVPLTQGPSSQQIQGAIEQVTGPLHKPETKVGQYVNAVGELAPAAVMGPGGVLRNLLGFAVAPGVTGEAAVDVTGSRGTQAEPWARVTGQLTAAGAGAYAMRPRGPRTLANATEGTTVHQFAEAEKLFQEALRAGVPISRAEALQHVTNGATRLGDIQRVVEGQGRMRDFYANRVQSNDNAFGVITDSVQPNPTSNPSSIGPQVAAAAEDTLGGVRRVINDATDPLYKQAGNAYLSPADMGLIKRSVPGFEEALAAVRGDVQRNRNVAHLPDNNVLVLNEVKKYLDEAATNAASPMAQQRSHQRAAGFSQDAEAIRQVGIQASGGPTGPYAIALEAQKQAREKYLEPLLHGPLGNLAKDDVTTKQAIEALFPTNPLPNSAQEISTAVTALAKRNPRAAQDLVRAHLESVFNEATQRLQGGLNQFSGAGFAAVLRGNPQQAANLEAAVRALPNGEKVWPGVDKFLQFMEAQGQRQRIGSQTSFNTEFMNELKGSNTLVDAAVQGTKTGFVKIPERLNQVLETWRLGQNVDQLARLLTDPRAGREFQRLATLPPSSAQAVALMNRIAIMAPSVNRPPQQGQ